MAAVKNASQTPPTFDLRELISFNGPQDKKGASGDITTKFWDLLNKIEEDDQGSPSTRSAPLAKERLIQEKPSFSPSSCALDFNKASQDPSAEITMQEGKGKKEALTMTELSVLNPQHLLPQPLKESAPKMLLNQDQGSVEKSVVKEGVKNDRPVLKNDRPLYEDIKLKAVEDKTMSPSQEIGSPLLTPISLDKSSQQKVHIEIVPKAMDTTPLAIKAERFPNESPKTKEVPGSVEEEGGWDGQEKTSFTPLNSPSQASPKSKTTHAQGTEETRHDGQPSITNPSGFVMQNVMAFKNNVSPSSGTEGNKVSGIGQNMSISGQKIQEQKADGAFPITSKTLSMADKIKALNQIRSELKATLEKGETHLKIQLVPDELGKIEIKVDIDRHGVVQAMFMADNRETMEHIAKYGHEFVQIFQDSGLQTDLNSMNFQSRQQSQEGSPSLSHPPQEFGVSQETGPTTRRVPTTQIDIEV